MLRPLSIGEMLDRAVTLSVRYFVPLFTIWALFAVPLSVFQFYGSGDQTQLLDNILRGAMHGVGSRSNGLSSLFYVPQVFNGYTVAFWTFMLFGTPLGSTAIMTATDEAYVTGNAPAMIAAYRVGAKHWLAFFGILLIWLAFMALAFVGLSIAAVVVNFAAPLAAHTAKSALTVFLIGILLVAGVGLAGAILCSLAAQIGFYTQLIEDRGVLQSVSSGVRRVFGKSAGRSIRLGAASAAIWAAFLIFSGGLQVLALEAFHSSAAAAAVGALFTIALAIFANAVTLVYYYDIRIRTEGLDLQLALRPGETVSV